MQLEKRHWAWLRACLLVGLSASVLGGCAGGTPPPTLISAEIAAEPGINPNAAGQPSPLVVRLYELKTTGSFEGADFFTLFDKESAALGPDLLAREELDMRPGTARTVVRKAAPDTQYLGVVGAYRDLDESRWRATYPLHQGKDNLILIRLGPHSVTVTNK
ncbi:MAG: type VI secretion system lipoprotein TssJ [Chromatiaceae bacterium]